MYAKHKIKQIMKALTGNVAKIIYSIPMILFGVFHFMMAENMAGMVPSFVPGGIFWVYLTGVALIAAGVAIIINKMARLAALLLAVLLLIFVLAIHLPGAIAGEEMAMPSLLKDIALMAGALLIAGSSK